MLYAYSALLLLLACYAGLSTSSGVPNPFPFAPFRFGASQYKPVAAAPQYGKCGAKPQPPQPLFPKMPFYQMFGQHQATAPQHGQHPQAIHHGQQDLQWPHEAVHDGELHHPDFNPLGEPKDVPEYEPALADPSPLPQYAPIQYGKPLVEGGYEDEHSQQYENPQPMYESHEPAYQPHGQKQYAPKPAYEKPTPAYEQHQPMYHEEEQHYEHHAPEPAYEAPAPMYHESEPAYEEPKQTPAYTSDGHGYSAAPCGKKILLGCAPIVQYVSCGGYSSPPSYENYSKRYVPRIRSVAP